MKRSLAAFALFGCLTLVSGCGDSTPKSDPAAAKKALDDSNANLAKKSAETVKDRDAAEKADDGAKADDDKSGDDEKAKDE
jgi:hypothetical protein